MFNTKIIKCISYFHFETWFEGYDEVFYLHYPYLNIPSLFIITFYSSYFNLYMYLKSNYFISAFQSCLSIQANSHLVNSPHFCQQSYQPTNPIFKFVNPVSNPPLLDIFPQSKNPWISFRLRTRPQITESLYLLILLHAYLSTLDINTTVSTCDLIERWYKYAKLEYCEKVYPPYGEGGGRKRMSILLAL